MTDPHPLATALKAFIDQTTHVGDLTQETLAKVASAVDLFPLAPDEYVDVKRIPTGIMTFQGLMDYLKQIQAKIRTRPPSVSNQEWEVAQKGELKLYKLLVCGIHAVSAYTAQNPGPNLNLPVSQVSDATIIHAATNAPAGLSQSGTTLWRATFSGAVPRTKACMNTIYFLLSRDSAGDPPEIVDPEDAIEDQEDA
jgi:hypothetical protein